MLGLLHVSSGRQFSLYSCHWLFVVFFNRICLQMILVLQGFRVHLETEVYFMFTNVVADKISFLRFFVEFAMF